MAHNFNRDKRRIEETKKKKQEEKRLKKLQRAQAAAQEPAPAEIVPPLVNETDAGNV